MHSRKVYIINPQETVICFNNINPCPMLGPFFNPTPSYRLKPMDYLGVKPNTILL